MPRPHVVHPKLVLEAVLGFQALRAGHDACVARAGHQLSLGRSHADWPDLWAPAPPDADQMQCVVEVTALTRVVHQQVEGQAKVEGPLAPLPHRRQVSKVD